MNSFQKDDMKKNTLSKRILWLDPDRFDLKPNKSPWLEMSKAMCDYGFDVSIVTGYGRERYKSPYIDINMIYLHIPNIPGIYRYGLLFRMFLWAVVKHRKGDIFIVNQNGLFISPLLKLIGVKNIHLDIRSIPIEINSFRKRIDRLLFWKFTIGYLKNYVNGYSFITDRLKDAVENEFNTSFRDYVIWESGVNTNMFHPIDEKVQTDENEIFKLIYHGSISKDRGLNMVIEAISILDEPCKSNIRLVIIGRGPGVPSLKGLVEKHGLTRKVIFKGLMPYEDMPAEIAKADYGIYPLPDRPEWNISSPIKIFEYIACGKPTILTTIPAHIDICEGQEFIVWVEGEEVIDFKNAILKAYNNREYYCEVANKYAPLLARERYDWKVQANKLVNYFNKKYL